MSAQYSPPYAGPPPSSPPAQTQPRTFDPVKSMLEIDRSQREQSVLSGMSIEDMEAAETLNSLHKLSSPKLPPQMTTHVEVTTSYNGDQPEPLLSLVTSQYPLAGAVINGSLSAYKTTQSYIPGAQWTERNLGLPLAGTVARISGVEGGLRWALQSKKDSRQTGSALRSPDIEKGLDEVMPVSRHREGSEISIAESLPAYNAADKSPPYEQQSLLTRERPSSSNWRQQLVISTSGLGIAMSDESLRSLRYCLRWLRWANDRLGTAIQSLRELVEQWSKETVEQDSGEHSTEHSMSQQEVEGREAVLAARISAVKAEVLQTLKQVMNVVSTYAGGALPENARNLVHRHLTSLPQRFSIASAMSHNETATQQEDDATTSANRVMVLAQEGLDMMTQVSRVVNDTLVSAEGWCERLGRRKRSNTDQQAPSETDPLLEEKPADTDHDMNIDQDRGIKEADGDVKMEM